MKKTFLLAALCCLFFAGKSYAQDTLRVNTAWNAKWIGINIFFDMGDYYSVNCYHKTVNLGAKPSTFRVHMSADNHYKLFINGNLVSVGPARADKYHWKYETINIAKYLKAGNNDIAAQVWNEDSYRPHWQLSVRTAFILQGNTPAEEVMNTNNTWKCYQDKSNAPVYGYFVAVNGQRVNMSLAPPAGWNKVGFNDSAWPGAAEISSGQLKGSLQMSNYMLVPSLLPQRELTRQNITVIRQSTGVTLPNPPLPLTIPANKLVTVLLDQTFETNAFPTIKFSGGAGAGISLGYAESLYEPNTNFTQKPNRNTVTGKVFRGLTDTITSNGTAGQSFSPFHFRTYRYLKLTVKTAGAALTIDSLYGTFTAYPFKQKATIVTANPEIQQIRDIGWRTARLNAYETYTDCPYYEQLQYIADTRVQAMVSYYESGDDLLARNAINLFNESGTGDGITLSNYPTTGEQVIPPFSLLYIGMLHDYYMYRNDNNFIKEKLHGMRGILSFFSKYQGTDGSVVRPPYWNYVDGPVTSPGSGNWFIGVPPFGSDGCSASIDLQLLWAYKWAAILESALGSAEFASLYNSKAAQLKSTIQSKYWDAAKLLYADTQAKNSWSQAANALAILTDVVSDADKPAFAQRMVNNAASLTQCNIYFRYYLHQALNKGGLGGNYMSWLDIWRNNINNGLTTWAEVADLVNTRSDCHGWGASPNIEFFRILLGIDTAAPNFAQVKIKPNLGTLTSASGSIPHPGGGTIMVSYVFQNPKWKIDIALPSGVTGTLVWNGVTYNLTSGMNSLLI